METQTNLKNFTGFFLVLINFFALTSVCESDEQEITEVLIIGSNADLMDLAGSGAKISEGDISLHKYAD